MFAPKEIIRVLVAEDDYLVGKDIARSLKGIGHQVVAEVANGEQAVKMACKLKPDVILMDIQMPVMDGLKASNIIQEKCPTPVVVLTAYESLETVQQAGDMGVGAYLTKPPQPAEIERAITIAMARHADLMICRNLYNNLEQRNKELEQALVEIKTLRGILPICANCKKIRDDKGYWNQIEAYISEHSQAEFSHGLCPECIKELYPDMADEVLDKDEELS
ncbi:ANTAR domain-containing response regulator [Dethiosulfatarculus sandiegensis]|uniref:Histidine kinase n=1 Tax=Dethiosulfatarculus sandiegensis TaxID=1429043 RepID=A0A0D2GDE1_9BACT|nr:response regulator [Dethiosulfatarculus sandiegensis]KIX12967.1 histidine kinase [Dethiosulfatarculus sandiegensis]